MPEPHPHTLLQAAQVPIVPNLSGETDEELLCYLALSQEVRTPEEQTLVRVAFRVFHERHAGYLRTVVGDRWSRVAELFGGVDVFVNEVFLRVLVAADKYDVTRFDPSKPPRQRVRAWMGQIAHNLVQDHVRHRDRRELEHTPLDERLAAETADEGPPAGPTTPEFRRICAALDSIPEREQHVLRVSMIWQKLGADGRPLPLPDAELEALAAQLDTSPENVRQIRRRALEKVRVRATGAA